MLTPASFLDQSGSVDIQENALLVLNQPITCFGLFQRVWDHCGIRVCADGAANHLHDSLDPEIRQQYKPDGITGDLDSIRQDVKEYYESIGVPVTHNPDQYSTDFMKALELISSTDKDRKVKNFLALGAMGGRVDQAFHSIHCLFLVQEKQPGQRLVLVSEQSVSLLIQPGGPTTIATPQQYLGQTCGIIPLNGSTKISTTGFKWDVQEWETSFSTQMSTSNHLVQDQVTVQCDKPVLFTVELRPLTAAAVSS